VSGAKTLFEFRSVHSLGTIVLDGEEHDIQTIKVRDMARLPAHKDGGDEKANAERGIELIRLAIPTLPREQIDALELEVMNAIVDIVARAMAARAAEKEAALRASPLYAAS
jgi:hypothetical protein